MPGPNTWPFTCATKSAARRRYAPSASCTSARGSAWAKRRLPPQQWRRAASASSVHRFHRSAPENRSAQYRRPTMNRTREHAAFVSAKLPISARAHEPARETLGPLALPGFVGDEVLPNLDLDMRQAAPLAVDGDRIIGAVGDRVRLVVADDPRAFCADQLEQHVREPRVAVVEHADVPWPREIMENRREAVHRDQHGRFDTRAAAVELGRRCARDTARRSRRRARPHLRGERSRLPGMSVRSLRGVIDVGDVERPVAVDDEARIGLRDQHGVEHLRHARRRCRARRCPTRCDAQVALGEAERTERARDAAAGMIADEDERRAAVARARP